MIELSIVSLLGTIIFSLTAGSVIGHYVGAMICNYLHRRKHKWMDEL